MYTSTNIRLNYAAYGSSDQAPTPHVTEPACGLVFHACLRRLSRSAIGYTDLSTSGG
jgi:hypothetical protein